MPDDPALTFPATQHEEPGIRPAPRRLIRFVRRAALAGAIGAVIGAVIATPPPPPALAHGDGASILVVPATVRAGDEVTIVGDDLDPNDAVRLEIVTATGPVLLAEPVTDVDGHATVVVRLPADLTARSYEVRGTLRTGYTVSAGLLVTGPPAGPPDDGPTPLALVAAGAIGLLVAGAVLVGLRLSHRGRAPGDRRRSRKDPRRAR